MSPDPHATAVAGQRQPRRWRFIEVGFWVAFTVVNAVANSAVELMELQRAGFGSEAWKPVLWEWTSALALLALVPFVAAYCRRWPLHWDTLTRSLPMHLLGSVAFSLAHVGLMVAMREAAYATQGQDYVFGAWDEGLLYEFLKDARAYALVVAVIEIYRFVRRRLQGEAAMLAAPDAGEPVEPIDRPQRFLVRKLGREFLVAAADVEWLQASGNYVNLRVRGFDYPLRSTVAAIESRLDPDAFCRVHRSWIVNLGFIASIEPLDSGDARVHMKDGAVVPCSRTWRDALRQRMQPS